MRRIPRIAKDDDSRLDWRKFNEAMEALEEMQSIVSRLETAVENLKREVKSTGGDKKVVWG